MNNRFFHILGTPRSGTAFLAWMFNLVHEGYCTHDLAADYYDWSNAHRELARRYRYVGASSTYVNGLGGIAPDAVVYVERRPEDFVPATAEALGLDLAAVAKEAPVWLEHNRRYASKYEALEVPFDELFKLDTLRAIWSHALGPSVQFPADKVGYMIDFNIQRNNPAEAFTISKERRTWALLPQV